MSLTVSEIAARLDASFDGDGECAIAGVAGIRDAVHGDITFVSNPRYAAAAAGTRASAILVPMDWDRPCPAIPLRVEAPDAAFARVTAWFAPPPVEAPAGIHPSAVVDAGAEIGADARIGPHCVVEPGARLGDRVVLMAGCYVGHGSVVGDDVTLYPHVTLRERVRLGSRVIVHNGAVIGSDGFGYTVDERGVRKKIPQLGTVQVGDDVEIGANTTIDRARFGKTVIGNGVKIDNLVQVAHNVVIGDHAVIVAQVGIAGSTFVGGRAVLAGQAGVAGHLVVGEGAIVGGQAGVTKSVAAGAFVSGYPAAEHHKATRVHAHLMRLPELKERVDRLEARLARLEQKAP